LGQKDAPIALLHLKANSFSEAYHHKYSEDIVWWLWHGRSQPSFTQCNPLWLSSAGVKVYQGKQRINMDLTSSCLTPLVTVKGDEKLEHHFTCLIWCL